eukprot:CAMPEP_0182528038 /NCGR_PEP_ID=MMETSP1323-20130603/4249_1 /TAXON_ID=236787 /ORGANISM="Florenciella parvula, Strain RCC1693" /LENGTH=126 /DNA_ID=CAMNT_0024737107 /DNA_START=29 /DNA_END=411 /DNA_ORIENTATION=-
MSSSSDRDRPQARTDNLFANGGNNNDDGQDLVWDLVWNPATETFDWSVSSTMDRGMVSTTKDCGPWDVQGWLGKAAAGEFVAASSAAYPQATEVQEAALPPGDDGCHEADDQENSAGVFNEEGRLR